MKKCTSIIIASSAKYYPFHVGLFRHAGVYATGCYCNAFSSHLDGSSTSVGRPGNCQSQILAIENVDVR